MKTRQFALPAPLALFASLSLLASCQGTSHRTWTDPTPLASSPTAAEAATASTSPAGSVQPTREAPPTATHSSESSNSTPTAIRSLRYGPMEQEVSTPVTAQVPQHDYANIYDKWGISLGAALLAAFHTKLQVSSPVLVGAILDLEDLLGVSSESAVIRLDTHYNFNKKHRVDLSYYDIRRSGSRGVAEDIEIGDVVIPAGNIDTIFNTQILKLAYRYNFVTDYRTVIGASFGFHTMQIKTGLRATAGTIDEQEEFKALAPLPLLGLHGAYALSEKWRLRAGFEALRVTFDNFSGFVFDSQLNLEHNTFEHVGWGIGLNSFSMGADIEGSDNGLKANIDYGYTGLMVYLRSYF